jgi:hypothetical protein
MAHYALLNENNIVVQVITGIDENELIEGKTPEQWYGEFHNMKCVRTSYNTYGNSHKYGGVPFRKNYAGKGYRYDDVSNAFIAPKPFPSWRLNYSTFLWEAPIPQPEIEKGYLHFWSEDNQEWIKLAIPAE